MKNLKLMAVAIIAIAFGSCSSDDNNDNNNNSGGIEGTYNLTQFNTSVATDFNKDGNSSTNQMEESECYDPAQITLKADNTFKYVVAYITVNTDASSTCTAFEVDGTWTATNNTLTATYEDPSGDDVTVNFARSNNGRTLTETRAVTRFPDRDSDGGATTRLGSVQLVFEK